MDIIGIVGIIVGIVVICAVMYLKGKAWNNFVDDVTKKDKKDDGNNNSTLY